MSLLSEDEVDLQTVACRRETLLTREESRERAAFACLASSSQGRSSNGFGDLTAAMSRLTFTF